MTDLPLDVVTALVFAATATLAFVTYKLASATAKMAKADERQRLDALGPLVTVHRFSAYERAVRQDSNGKWVFSPNDLLDLTQLGSREIMGIRAELGLFNEGDRTAFVTVTLAPDAVLENATREVDTSSDSLPIVGPVSLLRQGGATGAYWLPPKTEAWFRLVRHHNLRDWAKMVTADAALTPTELATVEVVSASTDAVKDTIVVSLAARAVGRYPTEDKWVPAPGHQGSAYTVPKPVTEVGFRKREYRLV